MTSSIGPSKQVQEIQSHEKIISLNLDKLM